MTDHLHRQQLLGYLDGELSRKAMRKAKEHIQSCWTCRIALERMQEDIRTILDAQNRVILPSVPPPPRPWSRLEPRLTGLGAKESWLLRMWRPVYLSAALAAVVVIAALLWFSPSTLSAKEVLRKLSDAEARRMSSTGGLFVRQKVRVLKTERRSGKTNTGEVDSWRSSNGVHWKVGESDPVALDLQERYRARNTLSDLPLSASSCDHWSADGALPGKVVRSNDEMEVTFTAASPGSEANFQGLALRVNLDDWRVTQMRLEFSDAAFDISEEELGVFSRKDVPADVLASFEPPAIRPGVARVSSTVVTPPPAVPDKPDPLDLDEEEMNVRFALHQIGADLGEPIEIKRGADAVVVRAWQVSAERKEILKAVLAKPHVRLELVPLREESSVTQLPPMSLSAQAPVTRREDEQRLLKWFGSASAKEAYTKSVLNTMTDLLSRLFAVKQLADRWPASAEAGLSAAGRDHLSSMVQDNVREATNRCVELQTILKPLVQAFAPGASSTPNAIAPPAWQNAGGTSLDAAKQADRILRSLLTTTNAPLSLDNGLPFASQKLADLEAQLRAFRN